MRASAQHGATERGHPRPLLFVPPRPCTSAQHRTSWRGSSTSQLPLLFFNLRPLGRNRRQPPAAAGGAPKPSTQRREGTRAHHQGAERKTNPRNALTSWGWSCPVLLRIGARASARKTAPALPLAAHPARTENYKGKLACAAPPNLRSQENISKLHILRCIVTPFFDMPMRLCMRFGLGIALSLRSFSSARSAAFFVFSCSRHPRYAVHEIGERIL